MHSIYLPTERQKGHAGNAIVVQRAAPRIRAVPRDKWPLWTCAIAKLRRTQDTGLGDTIVHLIGDTRSERFKKWFLRKFGRSCGCTERQRWLNQNFPYAGD
jgi:hypothetical protein